MMWVYIAMACSTVFLYVSMLGTSATMFIAPSLFRAIFGKSDHFEGNMWEKFGANLFGIQDKAEHAYVY